MNDKATIKMRRKPEQRLPAKWTPRFLDSMDSRLSLVRRLRGHVANISEEVNADSTIKKVLVDRLCFLVTFLETIEAKALLDGNLDAAAAGQWIQATNAVQGLARMLGVERKAKRIGGLTEYVNSKRGES